MTPADPTGGRPGFSFHTFGRRGCNLLHWIASQRVRACVAFGWGIELLAFLLWLMIRSEAVRSTVVKREPMHWQLLGFDSGAGVAFSSGVDLRAALWVK